MAFEQKVYDLSLVAAADFTNQQYRAMILNAAGNAAVAGAAAEAIGVLQNNPLNGGEAQIRALGITKMVVGEAIAINDNVGVDAAGEARTAVLNDPIIGRALTAGAVGNIVSVLLNTSRRLSP